MYTPRSVATPSILVEGSAIWGSLNATMAHGVDPEESKGGVHMSGNDALRVAERTQLGR